MKRQSIVTCLAFVLMCHTGQLYAQVSINTNGNPPDNSAILDVQSASLGFLPPRVTLTAANVASPVTSPATGLFVYNTATAGASPNTVVPGYYCWNGTRWVPVIVPQGTNPGDMLYWNGVQWVCVPAGSNGQVLTFNNGVPAWSLCSAQIPVLITKTVSGILAASAASGGCISDGGSVIIEKGVCWSTSANPTTSDNKTTDGMGTECFNSDVTAMNNNTTYHIRAYATNSVGTGYGNDLSLLTQDGIVVLTTGPMPIINSTFASCLVTVTADGGASITVSGVCWSTAPNPTTANSKTTNGSGVGQWGSGLAPLTPNTPYYVRGYATNSVGTYYGNEISFTTPN